MSQPKRLPIKESENYLGRELKKCSLFLRPRLLMLIELKKNEQQGVSKRVLAEMLGVNHNSIQNWRKLYEIGGFKKLMSHKKIGFKPSVITKKEHKDLKALLSNPLNGIQGYKELKNWYDKQYNKSIPYTTITGYCIRHFSTKIKVARKSHVKKQEEAGVTFKKTLLAN